jgi:hypothetical protein
MRRHRPTRTCVKTLKRAARNQASDAYASPTPVHEDSVVCGERLVVVVHNVDPLASDLMQLE